MRDRFLSNVGLFWIALAVVLLAWTGCRGGAVREVRHPNGDALAQVTEGYLVENVGIAGFGGEIFCASEVVGLKEEGDAIEAYLWVLCQEYYWRDRGLELGTGCSLPVALVLKRQERGYDVLGHRVPRDGSLYAEDIRAIFPRGVQTKILSNGASGHNRRVWALERQVERDAITHFSVEE